MQNSISYKTTSFLLYFTLLPLIIFAQWKVPSCAELKDGIFHNYPKNSAEHYISIREGNQVHEINLTTGDSSLWQIKWMEDCIYSLKYVSGNLTLKEEDEKFLKKHKLVYQIGRITKDYYTFTGYIDKVTNAPIQADTMWMTEKVNPVNNELFKPVKSIASLKKEKFSDTSQYAVLYLYRKKKVTNSLGNYLVYFDNNLMCVAQNNSGYIFKILKEGNFEIKSKLLKDEASIKLTIEFGQVYYVKSIINWGITSRLYNFRLDMANMPLDEGKLEFNEVDIQ